MDRLLVVCVLSYIICAHGTICGFAHATFLIVHNVNKNCMLCNVELFLRFDEKFL